MHIHFSFRREKLLRTSIIIEINAYRFNFVAPACAEAMATPFSHVRPLGDVKCRLITLFFPRPLTGYAIVIGRILIVRDARTRGTSMTASVQLIRTSRTWGAAMTASVPKHVSHGVGGAGRGIEAVVMDLE